MTSPVEHMSMKLIGLGCSGFLHFLACTILDRGPALVACRCLVDGARTQPHSHSLTVKCIFQFCTVKVSQRPLRCSWVQVLGAFWVRNDVPLANIPLGWKVRRACRFLGPAPCVCVAGCRLSWLHKPWGVGCLCPSYGAKIFAAQGGELQPACRSARQGGPAEASAGVAAPRG